MRLAIIKNKEKYGYKQAQENGKNYNILKNSKTRLQRFEDILYGHKKDRDFRGWLRVFRI